MTAQPNWSPVDEQTGSLLDLLADDGSAIPGPDEEWHHFVVELESVARMDDGVISPNEMRPRIRDKVAPRRVGPFYRRACLTGLIAPCGYDLSNDTKGKNAGRPIRLYAWKLAAR